MVILSREFFFAHFQAYIFLLEVNKRNIKATISNKVIRTTSTEFLLVPLLRNLERC